MPVPISELFFVIRTNPDPSGTAKIFGIYENHARADDNILEFDKDPATSGLYEVAVLGSGLVGPPGSGGGGGGGNTLDQAYDEGGAGAGRTITADTGAVQIDGSNQLTLDVNQADDFGALNITKSGTGAGVPLSIENDGTDDGIFLNQDGNAVALNIDSEATSSPAIKIETLTICTKGDISFFGRTFQPSDPDLGDVWYNHVIGALYLFDGSVNVDLTGGNTLDAAYDQNGFGLGRFINVAAGLPVLLTGTGGLLLDLDQGGAHGCIEITKTAFAGGIPLSIENDGTDDGIFLNQDGNAVALNIDSEATSSPLITLAAITGNARGDIAFGTARTGDPSSPSEGDLWYQSTLEFLKYRDSTKNISLTGINRKSILVEDPTSTEDLTMFFTEEAITVRQVEGVLRGSTTPSVTISVMHNTNRNSAGNNVLTSATAITSTTTGDSPAIGGDVTIPANSFVWLETSAKSGTVNELNITIKFTED